MSDIVFLLHPRQNHFFTDLANLIGAELAERFGASHRIERRGFSHVEPQEVPVLLPPHEYFALSNEVERQVVSTNLGCFVGIGCEQPKTPFFDQNVELLTSIGSFFDISTRSVKFYRSAGIDAHHFQLGYMPTHDRFRAQANRPIDVLFLGARTERRDAVLAQLGPVLSTVRAHIVVSDNSAPNSIASHDFVTGDEKAALLSGSKLLLNIHQSEEPYFEWLRYLDAAHCGAVLLTDRSSDHDPLIAGEHFLSADVSRLDTFIAHHLRHPEIIDRIRIQAYDLLRDIEIEPSLNLFMSEVERVGGAQRFSIPPATVAVLARFFTAQADPPAPYRVDPQSQALKSIRLDLLSIKRTLTSLVEGVAATEVVVSARPDTVGFKPKVSVVMPVFNHRHLVHHALNSLLRIPRGFAFEVVVVDDGSTDGSAELVEQFRREHSLMPITVLRHSINRGLGSARNTAVGFSQGQYIFNLDADNEMYRNCLPHLADALDKSDAVFAYPLIERFTESGPVGLMPPWSWNPNRLRAGNYIDAMAMIRRHAILDLGGYTTDHRLYGWEDYELWLQVLKAGGRGVLVRNILARYFVGRTSMVSTTNIDQTESLALLHSIAG